jgi:hypothetical protein
MNAIRMATTQKSQRLAVFGWKLTAPFIRLLRLDRALWKKRLRCRPPSPSRQIALAEVKKDEAFYRAIPYRPSYHSPFHEEKLLTAAALDVAELFYFESNIGAYRRAVEKIGSYLKHTSILNDDEVSKSDIWIHYLHCQATLESLFGNPSAAARLHSEAKQLCTEICGRGLDALTHEGCTMCCRVESLTGDEDYLLAALDSQIVDLSKRVEAIQDDMQFQYDRSDLYTRSFYVAMLRCKVQAHANRPDIAAMQSAIERAKSFRKHLDSLAGGMYDAIVPFYEALLSMLKSQPPEHTADLYDRSLEALRKSRVPYSCLLRVPDPVAVKLANYVRRERVRSSDSVARLKIKKTRAFMAWGASVAALAITLPVALMYVLSSPRFGFGFVNEKGVWYAAYAGTFGLASFAIWTIRHMSERLDRGLVSPSAIFAANIASGFCLTVSVALIGKFVSAIATR